MLLRFRLTLLLLVFSGALASVAGFSPAAQAKPTQITTRAPIPPRMQWNANYGYCGETSFISAGLRYGQYTSQWTARRMASPGVPQWREDSQLLLGVNAARAAHRMRLQMSRFDHRGQTSPDQFLGWAKREFLLDHTVVMGVFNNTARLGEPQSLASSVYDHIVPMLALRYRYPFGPAHLNPFPTDRITISDNGLYTPGSPTDPPFLYTYSFQDFPQSRQEMLSPQGPMYALNPDPPSYGVAIKGAEDPNGETIPVQLIADRRGEGVRDQVKMKRPPAGSL